MEGADEIEIGQVDCGTAKSVCTKVDIHSYPTFKLFYNGEDVIRYQGYYLLLPEWLKKLLCDLKSKPRIYSLKCIWGALSIDT